MDQDIIDYLIVTDQLDEFLGDLPKEIKDNLYNALVEYGVNNPDKIINKVKNERDALALIESLDNDLIEYPSSINYLVSLIK